MKRVIGDRVVLEPVEEEHTGLIELPETLKLTPYMGRVVAIGPRVREDLKLDDLVMFNKLGAVHAENGDEHYIFLRELEILLVLES